MRKILVAVGALLLVAFAGVAFLGWNAMRGLDPAAVEAEHVGPADRFIEIDGARLRVRVEGPESAPPIVLLHGFAFSLESWDGWAAELSKTRRVIRYDLLGHGLSGPDGRKRYAPEERAAFHLKVMDALGVENADLAGNSLGGLVAWRFAAAHPERVRKLILVDSGGYSINGVGATPLEAPPAMKAFLLTAPDAGMRAMFTGLYGDDSRIDARRIREARDMIRRRGNGQALVDSIGEFVLPDPADALGRVTSPTLILWGASDALIPVEHAARFDADIPDSRVLVYDGVGHIPQEEIAARSAADALAFLDATTVTPDAAQ